MSSGLGFHFSILKRVIVVSMAVSRPLMPWAESINQSEAVFVGRERESRERCELGSKQAFREKRTLLMYGVAVADNSWKIKHHNLCESCVSLNSGKHYTITA